MERNNLQGQNPNTLTALSDTQIFKTFVDQLDGYGFIYKEKHLMNVTADDAVFPCVYVEEFRRGTFAINDKTVRQRKVTMTKMVVSFMALCTESGENINMHEDVIVREKMRDKLKVEAVMPFIEMYNDSKLFEFVDVWEWFTPPSRFDCNEVSVDLVFECKRYMQCQ